MSQSQEHLVDTIIVAEDSKPNRVILAVLLKKLGFEVLECADGDEAWKLLSENKTKSVDKKNVVAVFSDLMMPVMDGLELLRRTRNDADLAAMPFVLITAVSDKDFIFEAKSLNVNGYVLKPVSYDRVGGKLKELFPQRKFPQIAS